MKKYLIGLVLLWPLLGVAQSATNSETLIVGTKLAPPFVVRNSEGELGGLSIALFQRAADKLGLRYEFRETDLNGLIDGLTDGTLDVSAAALTVTASREKRIDFTHPFHTTGLAIAVPKQGNAVWAAVKRVFSWEFLAALAALGALLLVVGVLLWLAERRSNAEQFGGGTAEGIGASFWWAAVTMTTVGYGDKAPTTFWGRVVGLVWMFAAIILISSFTAAIATSLTVSQLGSAVRGVDDLPKVRVVGVADSASAEFLEKRGIGFMPRADLPAAVNAVATGEADALVYDAPILKYLSIQDYPRRIQVLPNTFERQDYAFALPEGSALREPLNQAILSVLAEDQWREVLASYLGDEGR
ncbi:transporter substrate-binding domain-containing protein [Litorivivens sp.]|uniref:transporter substrate-binding domain-containing protein n=1 Tax=Litorivivens sp. TaxID=2020868 RepID=UPI003565E908